jgi:hypothetical protein
MENRERDRVSQRSTPTEAGQLNRSVEEQKGIRENSGTSAEFGQSIGRSENLSEGGEMNRNRNQDEVSSNRNLSNESESTRRSGQGSMGSSSGRSSGSMGSTSDLNRNEQSGGRSSGSSGIGDSSSGRH